MAANRRHFGRVRRLPSGRYQARYPGPDGILRPAPRTFERRREAEQWLSAKETEITRGDWIDPAAGAATLTAYAEAWIHERPGLRPRTVVLYTGLLRNHIAPALGDKALSDLNSPAIRRWRRELLDSGVGPTTVAKAYRLLRTVLNTAVSDRLIPRNPCEIPGAGTEDSAERPNINVSEVLRIADAMPRRYRALVLVAAFGSLRWGEAVALARRHVDIAAGTVRVERSVVEMSDGSRTFGPPKTAASKRTVTLPEAIIPDIASHLDEFVDDGRDALLFVGPTGALIRRANFQKYWTRAIKAAGVSDIHFHDLRHTGNGLAAETGATLRDLMDRMGHSTTRAALIYLHRHEGRDRVIATGISSMVEQARAAAEGHVGGTN